MPSNSRILCSYNRRRVRIAPQHQLDDIHLQTPTKPRMDSVKSRPETKVSAVSENILLEPSVFDARIQDSTENEELNSIFRRRAEFEVENDLFAIKRANPVYDSGDEDDMSTPSKRQRQSQPDVLHWEEQVRGEHGNFSVSFYTN
jgi:hypothetical protein